MCDSYITGAGDVLWQEALMSTPEKVDEVLARAERDLADERAVVARGGSSHGATVALLRVLAARHLAARRRA